MNDGAEPTHSQKLRRLLITADAVGGVWQYSVDLIRWLVRDGVTVLLAVMGPPASEQQKQQLPAGVEMVHGEYALEWTAEPWAEVDAAGRWLLSLRDRFRPDLVHLNGYAHANLSWRCPVLIVAHSCVVSWWRAVHGCDPGPEWNEYRRRVQAGLSACTRVVAPSHAMASEVALSYRIEPSKISVTPNFSSIPVAVRPARASFFLAAGRAWDKAKNFALLRDVAGQISWPIRLAGDAQADALAPVKTLGRISHADLLGHMARANVFIHPALYEPFGLVVLEAARSGCCLVLSDIPSMRELWDGAALFADPKDPLELIEILNRLSADPEECARFQKLALERSLSYGEGRFRSSYRTAYAALLSGSASQKEAAA